MHDKHGIKDTTGGEIQSLLNCLLFHSENVLAFVCQTFCTALPGSLRRESVGDEDEAVNQNGPCS